MVFALAGDRLWVTTSRGSVKAAAWRRDDRVGGVVRDAERAVMFAGRAAWHDAIDPATWVRSVLEGPLLTLAAARFTRKNARFFAGYAVDADRVPFAWTPPGRVFVELRLDRWALLDRDGIRDAWGAWPDTRPSAPTFRRSTRADPLAALPKEVRAALGSGGDGVLALAGSDGPAAVPVRWTVDRSGLVAGAPEEMLALAGASTDHPEVALAADRASSWRARDMMGAMARGTGELASVARLTSGATSARAVLRDAGVSDVEGAVAIGIRPERLVWWRGWQSGTVEVA
jgi:hypothetical protein